MPDEMAIFQAAIQNLKEDLKNFAQTSASVLQQEKDVLQRNLNEARNEIRSLKVQNMAADTKVTLTLILTPLLPEISRLLLFDTVGHRNNSLLFFIFNGSPISFHRLMIAVLSRRQGNFIYFTILFQIRMLQSEQHKESSGGGVSTRRQTMAPSSMNPPPAAKVKYSSGEDKVRIDSDMCHFNFKHIGCLLTSHHLCKSSQN